MADIAYPFTVRYLAEDEGGGFLIEFPDLSGCVSDGDTIEDAIENGMDAVNAWIAAAVEFGDPVPRPGSGESYSGRWVQRVPKGLHARLVTRARHEGVSLNTFVTTLIAERLGPTGPAPRSRKTRKSPSTRSRRTAG